MELVAKANKSGLSLYTASNDHQCMEATAFGRKTVNNILSGLRVIESSAFVAVPMAGMTLSQMGAEVISLTGSKEVSMLDACRTRQVVVVCFGLE